MISDILNEEMSSNFNLYVDVVSWILYCKVKSINFSGSLLQIFFTLHDLSIDQTQALNSFSLFKSRTASFDQKFEIKISVFLMVTDDAGWLSRILLMPFLPSFPRSSSKLLFSGRRNYHGRSPTLATESLPKTGKLLHICLCSLQ